MNSAENFNANCYDDVECLARIIQSSTAHRPTIGIVCGSGMGKFAQLLTEQDVIPYDSLPNFPVATVVGHEGRFVFGKLEGKTIVCMQGRMHPYEGYELARAALPIRIMKVLGVETLILTAAVGGLNRSYKTGDMVVLKDHIFLPGFGGNSPLFGSNDDRFGPRFLPMDNAYNRQLRKLAKQTASELGILVHEGVYVMSGGPQFETPAECRFLLKFGGDVVGMSTAYEVIVARHCGLNVLAISLVTNMSDMGDCSDDEDEERITDIHAEVLEMGKICSDRVCTLIRSIVKKLPSPF